MLYYGAPPDDPYGMYAVSSRVLDTNDLPCGPLNKSGNWDVQDDDLDTDYQPLVQLPPKLLHLVPAWSSCHGNAFQGQDPPRTLSPATVLAPIRTTVHANPLPTPAAPGPPIRPLPVKTGSGAAQSLDPSQTTNPNNIAGPTADPAEATTSNAEQVVGNEPGASDGPASPKVADPPNFDPINPKAPLPTRSLAVVVQGLTITNNAALITVGGKTIAYQSGFVRVNNEVQQYPAAEKQNIANPSPVTVGGLTFSAIMPVARSNGESKDGAKASVYGMGSNALPDSDPGPNTYITVGGHTIAVQANGIAVAGETLRPGDPGITIDGTRISLGSSEFIVGDRTEIFSPPAAVTAQPTHITVNGEPISVGSDLIVVGGTTMKPGESGIIVHGKPVSLAASELVVGGVTESLTLAGVTPIPESSYTTLNGEIITIGTDVAVVGGNTLKPGGPGITIYGKLVSLGPSSIVVGGVTARLALLGATTTAAPSYITVNGETIAIGAGDVVVGGSTLKAGSPGITIDGKLVSLGSSDIVVGSVTEALGLSGSLGKTSSSYFTFDGETVAVGAGSVVVDGKTLTPGGSPVTVDGTMMSLGSSVLVVGSQTTQISLPAAPTTSGSGDGIGAMIMSGLGGMGGGTIPSPGNDVGLNGSENSNGIVPFMGKAAKGFGPVNRWCAWLVSLVALVLCA